MFWFPWEFLIPSPENRVKKFLGEFWRERGNWLNMGNVLYVFAFIGILGVLEIKAIPMYQKNHVSSIFWCQICRCYFYFNSTDICVYRIKHFIPFLCIFLLGYRNWKQRLWEKVQISTHLLWNVLKHSCNIFCCSSWCKIVQYRSCMFGSSDKVQMFLF